MYVRGDTNLRIYVIDLRPIELQNTDAHMQTNAK